MTTHGPRALVMAAAAMLAAWPADAQPGQAQPYVLVELDGTPRGLGLSSSKTSASLRVPGHADGGAWIDDGGQPCTTLAVPSIWDVTGTTTPVAPTRLPTVPPDKPASVVCASPDGSALGGYAHWRGESACGSWSRPAIWVTDAAGAWRQVLLDVPGGASLDAWCAVTGIANGARRAVGRVGWPILDPVSLTRVQAYRLVVWTRTGADTWAPALVPDASESPVRASDSAYIGELDVTSEVISVMIDENALDGIMTTDVPYYLEHSGQGWGMPRALALPAGASRAWARPGTLSAFVGSHSNAACAVLWASSTSAPLELPALDRAARAEDQRSTGTVVGRAEVRRPGGGFDEHAVKWEPPGWAIVDLNTVADTNGWTLETANGIDEQGRIFGHMTREISPGVLETKGFVLVPTLN